MGKISKSTQLKQYILMSLGLALIVAFSVGLGVWQHQIDLSKRVEAYEAKVPSLPESTMPIVMQSSAEATSSPRQNLSQSAQTQPAKTVQPAEVQSQAAPSAPEPSSQQPTVTATLNINGQTLGSVTVDVSANQCDILDQALKTGLISSLDMRYFEQYGSYAVYEINGVGDSGSVWWAYTVNGKSPPYGCNKMVVQNNDRVNWQYLKL